MTSRREERAGKNSKIWEERKIGGPSFYKLGRDKEEEEEEIMTYQTRWHGLILYFKRQHH
jgi:hypothetical protein